METRRVNLEAEQSELKVKDDLSEKAKLLLKEAATLLRNGELVAFPTETVYGLGANALDSRACNQIFRVKGRPADNPLIVHIASIEEAKKVVKTWSVQAEICAREFWPGPLTLVLPKRDIIPDIISGGLETVAVRMPAHPIALELIKLTGFPLAAPSANISGKPSPTEGDHVWQDLHGKIPLLIEAGKCQVGLESTVLDLSGSKPIILRPGGITLEQLRAVLGEVDIVDEGQKEAEGFIPRSPGMKYRHYAPQGELIVLKGDIQAKREIINKWSLARNSKQKLAVLCFAETQARLLEHIENIDFIFTLGSQENLEEAASHLFEALRFCDKQQVELILAEEMPEEGIGVAFMNRLKKAAGKKGLTEPNTLS